MMNVGAIDRGLRAALGVGLISLVFLGPQTAWGWLGLVVLGTSLVGWCPAYRLFGLKTCRTR